MCMLLVCWSAFTNISLFIMTQPPPTQTLTHVSIHANIPTHVHTPTYRDTCTHTVHAYTDTNKQTHTLRYLALPALPRQRFTLFWATMHFHTFNHLLSPSYSHADRCKTWGPWSPCTKSCGRGRTTRTRACSCRQSRRFANKCTENMLTMASTQSEPCNEQSCGEEEHSVHISLCFVWPLLKPIPSGFLFGCFSKQLWTSCSLLSLSLSLSLSLALSFSEALLFLLLLSLSLSLSLSLYVFSSCVLSPFSFSLLDFFHFPFLNVPPFFLCTLRRCLQFYSIPFFSADAIPTPPFRKCNFKKWQYEVFEMVYKYPPGHNTAATYILAILLSSPGQPNHCQVCSYHHELWLGLKPM